MEKQKHSFDVIGQFISPRIIRITNHSNEAIKNVDIGCANINRMADNFGQNKNISITSFIQNVSFLEFLGSTEMIPLQVHKTVFIASEPKQLANSIFLMGLNKGEVHGMIFNLSTRYKNDTNRLVDYHGYDFTGSVFLRFGYILGNSTITLYLYAL